MTKSSLFTLDTPDARLATAMHKWVVSNEAFVILSLPPINLFFSCAANARLEHVFYDLAKQHYADEIKRVMAHMEIANQETEVVRAQWRAKLDFISAVHGSLIHLASIPMLAARCTCADYGSKLDFLTSYGKT